MRGIMEQIGANQQSGKPVIYRDRIAAELLEAKAVALGQADPKTVRAANKALESIGARVQTSLAELALINPPTALYRHFNGDGTLLYVGISLSVVQRLSEHAASPWFKRISRIDVEWFDSRAQARAAEREAIQDERPIHNVVHAHARAI
jgi:hypothetical protein